VRQWSGKIRDIRGYLADCWDDFEATVQEVCGEKTLPQVLGLALVVAAFTVVIILLWAALSFLIALCVWPLWNEVMPHLGLPPITYLQAYCLTLLCAILFRGNSIHLKE
jgi:hypothetical protein